MDQISVVIPAYNAAWSIGETLKSVLHQTLPPAEIIIVDDGSTDALRPAVAAVAGRDPRVRILGQANSGLAAARNAGIRAAKSPLVALVDSDDLWHSRYLERVGSALAATPHAPFAYSYSLRIDGDNHVLPNALWPRMPRHDFTGLFVLNSVGSGSAAIFRRDLLLAHGGFDETLRARESEGAEDWKMVLRLAHIATPVLVPEYLVAYRLMSRSMSQSNPEKQWRAISAVLNDIRAELPVSESDARNARTMMTGWLAPALARKGKLVLLASLLARAYLLNPLWFRSADLRMLHGMKLRSMVHALRERLGSNPIYLRDQVGFEFLHDS
jgi:glycosyltransferase involved in cell wall biosynthesis